MKNTNKMTQQDCFIPLVPYESIEEYEDLLDEFQRDYKEMIKGIIHPSYLGEWCYIQGLDYDTEEHLMEHGIELFLKLTKGKGVHWCKKMNNMVCCALKTTIRVYVEIRESVGYPMTREFDKNKFILLSLLKKEVSHVIQNDWIYNTENIGGLSVENFKSITVFSDEHYKKYYYPIQKFQDMQLAFAMGLHERLGKDSSVNMLHNEMVPFIFSDIIF